MLGTSSEGVALHRVRSTLSLCPFTLGCVIAPFVQLEDDSFQLMLSLGPLKQCCIGSLPVLFVVPNGCPGHTSAIEK